MESAREATLVPLQGPVEMVVLQGTGFCNLNCDYCYLSEESRHNKAKMPLSTILTTFEKLLASSCLDLADQLRVSWHSGEPLVLSPAYYRAAMEGILELQAKHGYTSPSITFDIQTNGTLINQEWCNLLKEYRYYLSIGISCDGPAFLHDRHRKTWRGIPSHDRTQRGMCLLADNDIPFDITAVVSPEGLDYPIEFIEFFIPFVNHIREFHFNLHDEFFIDANVEEKVWQYCERYESFLRALLYRCGESNHSSTPRIRNFSSFYNRLFVSQAERPGYDARNMSKPFKTLSIEVNGDVTTFYAGLTVDECKDLKNLYGDGRGMVIGNILTDTLEEITRNSKLERITDDFEYSHRACESQCEYFELCSGGTISSSIGVLVDLMPRKRPSARCT
ncbi:radical SAM protein [Marinobacterium aestuariivivens]|uniref:Radical SAM protein n=1 Tax=Marinobacterium aestuariivivens TaxID=1698799 RepID=A0ABW2A0E8_9GAMM